MSFYENRVLPHFLHLACGNTVVDRQRAAVVPQARGRVLEVGMGSGLNIPHYDPDRVELVWGLEPSEGMRRKARHNVIGAPFEVRWLDLPGEEVPLDDNSVDTVVLTYTLCTIPDWHRALEQMRRVLKPGGQLLFCEHGTAPDEAVRQWQDRVNPLWRKVAGGCHLNRAIPELIEHAGFRIQRMETGYLPKVPRFAGFNFWGVSGLSG
ncbi:class I SAM-dependent methyltransferase [Halomonas sp. KAO]|nr:class I SAM-dependent methyltransferase [Halomonas sp. KAO]